MRSQRPAMARRWERHTPRGARLPERATKAAFKSTVTTPQHGTLHVERLDQITRGAPATRRRTSELLRRHHLDPATGFSEERVARAGQTDKSIILDEDDNVLDGRHRLVHAHRHGGVVMARVATPAQVAACRTADDGDKSDARGMAFAFDPVAAVRLFDAGKTVHEICRLTGATWAAVRGALLAAGRRVKNPMRGMALERPDRLVSLRFPDRGFLRAFLDAWRRERRGGLEFRVDAPSLRAVVKGARDLSGVWRSAEALGAEVLREGPTGLSASARDPRLTYPHERPIHVRARFAGVVEADEASRYFARLLKRHVTVSHGPGPGEVQLHATMPAWRSGERSEHHTHPAFVQFLRDKVETLGGRVTGVVDSTVANSHVACGLRGDDDPSRRYSGNGWRMFTKWLNGRGIPAVRVEEGTVEVLLPAGYVTDDLKSRFWLQVDNVARRTGVREERHGPNRQSAPVSTVQVPQSKRHFYGTPRGGLPPMAVPPRSSRSDMETGGRTGEVKEYTNVYVPEEAAAALKADMAGQGYEVHGPKRMTDPRVHHGGKVVQLKVYGDNAAVHRFLVGRGLEPGLRGWRLRQFRGRYDYMASQDAVACAGGWRPSSNADEPVRTKRDVVRAISDQLRVTQTQAAPVVQATLDQIADMLIQRGRVELRGFGVFELRSRAARRGVDPSRGHEPIVTPSRVYVSFRPSKAMVTRLRGHVGMSTVGKHRSKDPEKGDLHGWITPTGAWLSAMHADHDDVLEERGIARTVASAVAKGYSRIAHHAGVIDIECLPEKQHLCEMWVRRNITSHENVIHFHLVNKDFHQVGKRDVSLSYGRDTSMVFQSSQRAHDFLHALYAAELPVTNISIRKLPSSRLWQVSFGTKSAESEVRRLAAKHGGASGGEATPPGERKRVLVHRARTGDVNIEPSANSLSAVAMSLAAPLGGTFVLSSEPAKEAWERMTLEFPDEASSFTFYRAIKRAKCFELYGPSVRGGVITYRPKFRDRILQLARQVGGRRVSGPSVFDPEDHPVRTRERREGRAPGSLG